MLVRTPRRYNSWLVLLFSVLISLNIPLAAIPTAAQGQQLRLGDMRVDWYCLQRGYGAWIVNNSVDWACTAPSGTVAFMLSQSDFNTICQNYYGKPAAYAMRDRSTSVPALDWSCFVTIQPTPTPAPTLTPTPLMQPTRLGNFQVEWYCNQRGLGVELTNNDADWACTQPNSTQIVAVLGQQDFDQICQRTYNNPAAYALRDQQKPQPAYNWSCYVNVIVTPTPTALPTLTPTPTLQLTRLGIFQVEWYCNQRGLGVELTNNDADWACTQPNSTQIVAVLGQQDFDQICQRTYNDPTAFAMRDQSKPQPAYNWSCFTYRSLGVGY